MRLQTSRHAGTLGRMPRRIADLVHLSAPEAACLEAVRSGADTKTRVALGARLDLKQTDVTLRGLATAGLIKKRDRKWCLAPRGEAAAVSVVPDTGGRRGRNRDSKVRPGTSSDRLLALLVRPRRGAELAAELGVSLQRVHQLVVRLAALGLVRIGDPDRPLHIVARSADRSVLLGVLEETVLSAFPEIAGTTLAKIAKASRRTSREAASAIDLLIEHGLAEAAGPTRHGELYRLTLAGRGHWQRRPTRTADLPPLPVKSDRVRLVLAHLAEHGPTRTHTIGEALDIPRASINALMQYLKRKGLVRKSGTDLHAPHELTAEGEETLRGM
jgi:Mn-dependent DtxR family transcriptional regulator